MRYNARPERAVSNLYVAQEDKRRVSVLNGGYAPGRVGVGPWGTAFEVFTNRLGVVPLLRFHTT